MSLTMLHKAVETSVAIRTGTTLCCFKLKGQTGREMQRCRQRSKKKSKTGALARGKQRTLLLFK